MSQQIKQLEDRVSRLESDLKQLQQRTDADRAAFDAVWRAINAASDVSTEAPKRGPGRPKKAE